MTNGMTIEIAGRLIGSDHRPYIIAEMSGNHNGSLDRALQIVEAAAASGVDAIKLQTYTADTMTLDIDQGEFLISDPNSLWSGNTLYRLYQEAHTPWEWHRPIFDRCRELGVHAFSSPFDVTAVEFLESLDVPAYKIASFEIVDIPLIKFVAATGKPMIISTGMATPSEIDEAVRAARDAGCKHLALLKCTSNYPATPAGSNLSTIPHMARMFDCPVGLSDHTLGIGVPVASVALGAVIIEKHVTLDRAEGGVDAAFSLEPAELRALVEESERAWQAVGTVAYGPTAQERPSLVHRRSLYVTRDLKAGDCLTLENVRAIRPGKGLAPKHLDALLGRQIRCDVPRGTPCSWDMLA